MFDISAFCFSKRATISILFLLINISCWIQYRDVDFITLAFFFRNRLTCAALYYPHLTN